MKKNEIKRTIEQVVSVEYIAEDGQVFYNEEEARKYEESALFAVSKRLKRLNSRSASIYDLNEDGSDECKLEIFDVQTEEDLENLRRYLYLKLVNNGVSENCIKNYTLDNVTVGHEVMIFWSYDEDCLWTYKDGSLEGYFSWIRDKYTRIITPEENN